MRLLLALFHAPLRLLVILRAMRGVQTRAAHAGACRICGEPVVPGTDRCADCHDTVIL